MSHTLPIRVYYEDTDLGQIVYYANYLKFIERGRSEWLRAAGVDQMRMLEDDGLAFVVRRVDADYLRPAQYDDLLHVVTRAHHLSGSRIVVDQSVERDGVVLFRARVTLVCVALASMRPARLPDAVCRAFAGQVAE